MEIFSEVGLMVLSIASLRFPDPLRAGPCATPGAHPTKFRKVS
jgi:hypothetical protein